MCLELSMQQVYEEPDELRLLEIIFARQTKTHTVPFFIALSDGSQLLIKCFT